MSANVSVSKKVIKSFQQAYKSTLKKIDGDNLVTETTQYRDNFVMHLELDEQVLNCEVADKILLITLYLGMTQMDVQKES